MKKSKEILASFEVRMGLCGKAERRWFWAAFTLLLIYVECVILGQNIASGYADSPLLNVLLAVLAVLICFLGLLAVSRSKIGGNEGRAKDRAGLRKRLFFFAAVWAMTFFLFFLCQIANWPGFFAPDNIVQYDQMYRGVYNNWHPVLHTWLFYCLPFQFFHRPAGIILTQILWFSLAVAYLFYVLYTSGCPKAFLICGWLYITANSITLNIMLCPLKDSALTIFSAVMFAQLVRIYLTEGTWLKKWYNFAAFSIIAFLAAEMRHNAVLLVAPIFIILFFFFKSTRKRVILSALLVICANLLLKGPIFSLAHVTLPNYRTVETMGLPMTILSDIYVQDRDALSEEARTLMDSFIAQENWSNYTLGSFNSIKWKGDRNSIEEAGYKKLLQYTFDAANARPKLAWRAFCLLTRQVWEFDGENGWNVPHNIADNSYGINYHGDVRLQAAFSAYTTLASTYATKYLFRYPGIVNLILLFLAVGKLSGKNLACAFLVLAPMAYNFGTMLLLSGADYNFFHFNFVIVVPLVYLMLQKR